MQSKNKFLLTFCIILIVSTLQIALAMYELSSTIKYVNMWEGNPFNNAKAELNLVRVFDSVHTDIVIGKETTKTIKNLLF